MSEADKDLGLYAKYKKIERVEDPEGKHADCRYFVLDPQHDPIARQALQTYMHGATKSGFIALADDLKTWLKELGVED